MDRGGWLDEGAKREGKGREYEWLWTRMNGDGDVYRELAYPLSRSQAVGEMVQWYDFRV